MCPCTCCADALERVKFDRELVIACDCVYVPEDEQCDCAFCTWALAEVS